MVLRRPGGDIRQLARNKVAGFSAFFFLCGPENPLSDGEFSDMRVKYPSLGPLRLRDVVQYLRFADGRVAFGVVSDGLSSAS